ncbi:CRISPR-associated Cse3 family protein [Prauserella shujinwangii]|uniref:CRISPR-associated Cse3 family protein n=1 Tax=Prauserella shujinwangii TaxID=1453103 RepID=A0A2T0LKU3_9PSEU|nr:type I-E CRISPR-associated protein Cas6/Cse3/CasE [Prauserella shujinwangii]PRX43580.1 CRISPR-associated Cse3 family protein [Prauserella shujinwangii]
MYLSRLVPDPSSHDFLRDLGDLQHMHRTVMSGFPEVTGDTPARSHHAVLWRLDRARTSQTLYVQSGTRPDWGHLGDYLARPAEVRELSPVLDALRPGRLLAFRLLANPTKRQHPEHQRDPGWRGGRRDNRYPIRKPEDQLAWLIKQGQRHGFIVPAGADTRPDVAVSPAARRTGRQTGRRANTITVDPVRYDGHLVVTDPDALREALGTGIGPAKAYGCGLLTVAPPRSA